jgi:hypothetical protein
VNHRRLTIPAAVVGCLGIALAPAFAEASTSSQTAAKQSAVSSALSPLKSGRYTFDSPLSKSVFHKTVAAHAATATAGTTGPNPDLAVGLAGDAISSHGMEVIVLVEGLTSGTGTLTFSWGDGSTNYTATVTGSTADGGVQEVDVPDHTYSALGTYTLDATVTDGDGDTAENAVNATTGSDFVPFGPQRILNTRKDVGANGPVGANKTAQLQVVGAQDAAGDTVPAGITAVVLNVTVTEETANGYLTVYGDDDVNGYTQANPGTSNLNFRAGQNIANLVTVPVGTDGRVDFFNGAKGSTQVLADIAGYYTASSASSYVAITPARILDTRKGLGAAKAQIPSDKSINVTVAGANGIPATATAVAVNLTAVDAAANGLITAYPAGQTLPGVSNLNYPAGVTTANMAIIPIGTNGQVTFFNSSNGPTDLLADVAGYYTADSTVAGASAYIPFPAPERLYDSRSNEDDSLITGTDLGYPSPLHTNTSYAIPLSDPSQPLTTGVFNATVVSPTGNGYLAFYPYAPSEPAKPSTSNLNYRAGQTIPNSVFVSPSSIEDSNLLSDDGAIYLGGNGTAQVILDWFGVFAQ